MEVDGVPYYVTCWPRRDHPRAAEPLRPGHLLRVYNAPAPEGATLVERLTPDGARDGCTYLLRDYDRVVTEAPTADGPKPSARASRLRRHRGDGLRPQARQGQAELDRVHEAEMVQRASPHRAPA